MLIRKKLLGLFVVSTLSMAMVQAETVTQEVMIVGEDSVSAEVNPQDVPSNFTLHEEHFNAGKLSERGYLYEGMPVGEWQRWHENGQISTEAWFTTEGKPAGTWVYYDDAGKKIKEEIYEAGEIRETIEY